MNSVFIKSDRRTCFIIGAPIRFFPDETFGLKSESHHRGMKFGIALHLIRNWVQALPAGGADGSRTRVRKPLDITFSGCILFFGIPLAGRQQTGFSLG